MLFNGVSFKEYIMHLEGQYPVLRIYHTHVALWEAYFWKYTFKHGVSGTLLVPAVVQWLSHVPTLCILMECSTPGFPVIHYLLEFAEIHVYWIMMLSNHLILYYPLLDLPSIFPSIRVFPMSWLFTSGGQSIGVSASASVLPMTLQGWFPLGLTGLISWLSKGLSRVFSSTTARKHQFFGAQPSLWSSSHICTWLLGKP